MKAWRWAFHQEPELSNQEFHTRDRVVEALQSLEIPHRTFPGFTAVVGLIGADRPGPVVALRADMDALPVTERSGLPFPSKVPGRMHACGHDVHMTCLLGAAAILQREPARLRGPVRLLFQPAEEEGERGGALPLIEHGALRNPKVDFVLGQHVEPWVPLGSVAWKKGPTMAAADHFLIRIRGTPGHAASPHQGPDAILAATEVVNGLQALVSRMRDPADPVVVSVGMIHGGTRHNILPEEVAIEGTIRTLDETTRNRIHALLRRRVTGIARSLGARASVRIIRGYPVTVNDPEATEAVADAHRSEFGSSHVLPMSSIKMGAEDFSRYLEQVPGTFFRLGVGTPTHTSALHSPTFAPPEGALVVGAAALAAGTEGLQRA